VKFQINNKDLKQETREYQEISKEILNKIKLNSKSSKEVSSVSSESNIERPLLAS
jgi:hypothetical protein